MSKSVKSTVVPETPEEKKSFMTRTNAIRAAVAATAVAVVVGLVVVLKNQDSDEDIESAFDNYADALTLTATE